MTDIHAEWRHLMGRNAGEIMDFTITLVKFYWKQMGEPKDTGALDRYRMEAMSGSYRRLISTSMEFVLEETGIQLPNEYLLQ